MAQYTVIGRRWFEKVNGNTYHSVKVYKDGELIGSVPFAYGYGTQYEQSALEIIKQDDPTISREKYDNGMDKVGSLWQVKELGHALVNEVSDVQRKKDL